MKIFVEYESICTHSVRENKRFGSWTEARDFKVKRVFLDRKSATSWSVEEFELDVNPGDLVYVLSMTYSSGDSFGNCNGIGEVLHVFKDPKLAVQAKDEITKNKAQHSVKIKVDDDKTVELNNPSAGYFQSLEGLSVDLFVVQDKQW